MLEYNCRFNCEGGLTFNWNPEFSNLDGIVTHDSSLSQTTKLIEKVLEVGSNKGLFHISVPDTQIIGDFKLKFELVLKPTSKIPKKLYSGPEMCSSGSDSEPEYIKQRSAPTVIVPTSARSSAFVSSIRKLNAESKINGQQDLIEIASKLLETANEFNLPDMKEISTDFLDFQITNANFADILKIAVDQKNDTLLNFTTDYITVNQKELRSTEQWTKMMTSQLLISSIMEKLFIEKDFSDSFF